jgi:type I restriction enzyme M protein
MALRTNLRNAFVEHNLNTEFYLQEIQMINIRKLESELWESADLLRQGSKLTSNEYCMPVLGLIFLRYAYSRFKVVETEILKDRPLRGGRVLPAEANDFKTKSALFLPEKARYNYLLTLPDDADAGKAVNDAMELIEQQSEQLIGILECYNKSGVLKRKVE